MSIQPVACRADAYEAFAAQLPIIETDDGLLKAAVAISMHALDDVTFQSVDCQIGNLASRVSSRVRSRSVDARMAHLHHVLFTEEKFAGDTDNYYHPRNSYLSCVLQSRRGIPITLGLLYKLVAQRCGLQVEGVNAPAHFLVRVKDEKSTTLVDVFHKGRILTEEEAFRTMEAVLGKPVARAPEYLRVANHRQWISRILANLQNSLAMTNQYHDLAAMNELQALLDPSHA